MAETVPFTEAKAHLSELVDRVRTEHERVVLTRNGRPAAVLISPDDLESLEETLEILSDPDLLTQVRQGLEELDRGESVTTDEVSGRITRRR